MSNRAVSEQLAHGARLAATSVPDRVLAAAREERSLARLRRRISRWERLRRVR
jgi:hypothetical protein